MNPENLAAQWFTNKSYLEQHKLSDKYYESKNPSLLTMNQVVDMWFVETIAFVENYPKTLNDE